MRRNCVESGNFAVQGGRHKATRRSKPNVRDVRGYVTGIAWCRAGA